MVFGLCCITPDFLILQKAESQGVSLASIDFEIRLWRVGKQDQTCKWAFLNGACSSTFLISLMRNALITTNAFLLQPPHPVGSQFLSTAFSK